jgi:RecJ-like exonuclease
VRLACLMVLLLTGCQPSADYSGIYADLACEAGYAVLKIRSQINPTPTPPASDKCDNCDGTGIIGDGRVKIQCPECKGTGKKLKSVLVQPDCPDGRCLPR